MGMASDADERLLAQRTCHAIVCEWLRRYVYRNHQLWEIQECSAVFSEEEP